MLMLLHGRVREAAEKKTMEKPIYRRKIRQRKNACEYDDKNNAVTNLSPSRNIVVEWVLKISLPSSWRHQQCGHVVRSSSCVVRARGDPSSDEDPCGHGSS